MIKESEFRSKVIEKEFHKSLAMTEKDHKDFNNSTKCWICKEAYEKDEVKVKDHDHVTTKCRGPAHQECSLNLSLSKKKTVVFHDLQNYDSHLIFQEIRGYNFKVNVVPKTTEKYTNFTIQQPKKKDNKAFISIYRWSSFFK